MAITTPVTEPSDIQSTLGYSGIKNYGTIMTLDSINPYSFHKPVRSPLVGKLSEDVIKGSSVNNGFNYSQMFSSNIESILGFARTNVDWSAIYLKPRGKDNNEWYRTWDFVGYNHTAPKPYTYTVNDIVTYQPLSSVSKSGVFQLTINTNSEMPITQFGYLTESGALSDWKYGVICKKATGDTAATLSVGKTLAEVDPTKIPIVSVNVTLPSAGEYLYCFVATKGTSTSTSQPTVWLDGSYGTMRLTTSRVPIKVTLPSTFLDSISASKASGSVVLSGFSATATATAIAEFPSGADVSSVTNTGANIEVYVEATDTSGNVLGTETFTDSNTFYYSGSGSKSVAVDINAGSSINLGTFGGKVSNIKYLTVRLSINPTVADNNNGTFYFATDLVRTITV